MNDAQFAGIDVSKASLDVALLNSSKRFKVANTPEGIQNLIEQLPPPGTVLITLESSGGYERLVIAELLDANHQVACANARQVRDFAKALGISAKTDQIDAAVLAKFGQTVAPRCLEKPSPSQVELQELIERRRQLITLQTAEKNRHKQARSKVAKKSIQTLLKTLDKQIQALETQVSKLVQNDEEWLQKTKIITSVPGVGEKTSTTLLANLPELGKVNRSEITSLVGLAPYNYDSGQFKGKRAIRGGRTAVRNALYMATLAGIRCNSCLRSFYQRLKKEGKPSKLALTACMRKLIVILNTLVRENTTWNTNLS